MLAVTTFLSRIKKVAYFLPMLVLQGCGPNNKPPLFELAKNSQIDFKNNLTVSQRQNSFNFRNFYNGGGVGIGDINNDGLPDVILTSNMEDNKLFLNLGDFKFKDVSEAAGLHQDGRWSTGVVMVDVNADGWLDIYVCNSGNIFNGNRGNQLYINNHDLTFTESAAKYGLDHRGYSTQATFFDYDGDGDLDCFIIDNSPIPINRLDFSNRRDLPESEWHLPPQYAGGGNHLFRNDKGHYTEVSKDAGIHSSIISFGLGVSVSDLNGDGYPDIYVSNDSYERDYLYINQRNGTFKDQFQELFSHSSLSSMGGDIADVNNDGLQDVFTTDMLPDDPFRAHTNGGFDNYELFKLKVASSFHYQYIQNCLQLNRGDGFTEIANYAGVSASDWSWGALIFDMDNDGYNDIYVSNGINRDITDLDFVDYEAADIQRQSNASGQKLRVEEVIDRLPQVPLSNKAFQNQKDLRFKDQASSWGLTQSSFSNGAAYGDLDNDGDLDLVVNNVDQPAFIYRNNSHETHSNHSLSIQLSDVAPNNFAVGSVIRVYRGNEIFTREVIPARGFQSSVDYKQVIGLGNLSVPADSMTVTWPDRSLSHFKKISVDTLYRIQKPVVNPRFSVTGDPVHTIFQPTSCAFTRSEEDDFDDFNHERNIPRLLSKEGPKAAVADVNGDGLEDIYISGTSSTAGKLYLQDKSGRFAEKQESAFTSVKHYEDGDAIFFDYDHDGDVDLLLCPAGNDKDSAASNMQLRIFTNDGKGNFLTAKAILPRTGVNISVAIAADFNNDGYIDIFLGGRSNPFDYGTTPRSFVLINDGKGNFTDLTEKEFRPLLKPGMITGAVYTDLWNDKEKELLIVGEWMYPRIFRFHNNQVQEITTNLNGLKGWWQSVAVADIDGDGRKDIILGNIGENFALQPDSLHPVKLWLNDFNNNGRVDKILTSTIDGRDMPVFLKRDMEGQIPMVKNLRHKEYAKKSIQELFPGRTDPSTLKTFNFSSSIIAFSQGKDSFKIKKMPALAQFSSINAILPVDVNGDGRIDLVMGGNEFGFIPQFERLDGSEGLLLMNSGAGALKVSSYKQSGLKVKGMVRAIRLLRTAFGSSVLFLLNDSTPALYHICDSCK